MASYPYTTTPASLKKFLKMIPTIGVPAAVTTRWLPSVGFGSSNERSMIPVLKFVGLVEESGKPTELWMAFRHSKDGPPALAAGIRKAYSGLFETYPDADRKDSEALTNFFKAGSALGERGIQYTVQTFNVLCESGEFGGESAPPLKPRTGEAGRAVSPGRVPHHESRDLEVQYPAQPSVAINIQLQLPAVTDSEVYEKLFAAVRKHLFPEKSA